MSSLPTTLGKYQIIREIARSNDIVYEAYDPLMNRRVALKELSLPGGLTPQQKEDRVSRFMREARALGTLAHPNIMTVFEYGQEGERHFMAMEFLDGHTLRNEIDTKGFLDQERSMEIAIAVLRGLEHAHSKGVIHRDIKPDNIQILSNGEIKITDFGIARLTFQPNLTMDGQVFGTPSYMSPEQVVGKDIDARSDLFSVGVVLYEMISGQKPFSGDSVVAITYAIMNREPDRLQQVNHTVQQAISKAIDKSPALRYSSATEMVGALTQAKDSLRPGNVVLDPPAPNYQGTTIYSTGGFQAPQAPPPYNPYAPAIPMPGAPPVQYPYNPYQLQAPGMVAPHTGGMQPLPQGQGFPQLPVYYPPPPRQPLLKPETKHFIGKLFLTLIVMGTLLVVVIVGIMTFGEVYRRDQANREDRVIISRLESIPTKLPIDEQIAQAESLVNKLKSRVNKAEQSKRLAVLYERMGQAYMQSNRPDLAEAPFQRSVELDPYNHKLISNLAVLYGRLARAQQGVDQRQVLYEQAASRWVDAANAAGSDGKFSDMYREAAARDYYDLAYELYQAARFESAYSAVQAGRSVVPEASSYYRRLADLESLITSGR